MLRLQRVSLGVLAVLLLGISLACAQSTKQPTASNRTTTSSSNSRAVDNAAPLPGSGESRTSQPAKPAAPAAAETPAAATAAEAPSTSAEPSTLVRWYGHAFIYLVNSTGVRVAIDPFARNAVKYLFPGRLPADTVLISTEAEDHAAGELLFGTPQIFRSYTAVGVNKANGLIFKGVSVNRDGKIGPNAPKCTAFVFSLDGVNFAHLGVIGNIPDARQRQELGRVDVLFLPVGSPFLTVTDLNRIVTDLQAKIIVPITYKTEQTPDMNLRSLDDYLKDQKLPVKRLTKSEFSVNAELLPAQPTIYIPANP